MREACRWIQWQLMSMTMLSWKKNVHDGYNVHSVANSVMVAHRSVSMSSMAPNLVPWLSARAAWPSKASSCKLRSFSGICLWREIQATY